MSQGVAVLGGAVYSYFKYQMHLASLKSLDVYKAISQEFYEIFGRAYPVIEGYMIDDADYLLIMTNSFSTTRKAAIKAPEQRESRQGF